MSMPDRAENHVLKVPYEPGDHVVERQVRDFYRKIGWGADQTNAELSPRVTVRPPFVKASAAAAIDYLFLNDPVVKSWFEANRYQPPDQFTQGIALRPDAAVDRLVRIEVPTLDIVQKIYERGKPLFERYVVNSLIPDEDGVIYFTFRDPVNYHVEIAARAEPPE